MAFEPEEVAEKAIREIQPNADLQEGTPFHDLGVKINALITEKISEETSRLEDQLTLTNVSQLEQEQMDALAANFFVERNQGRPSVGVVRLFFDQAFDLFLGAGQEFVGNEDTRFVSRGNTNLTKAEMQSNQNENGLFTVDIAIESQNPGEGDGESIVGMTSEPSGLVKTETPEVPFGSVPQDTNEQLLKKIEKELGTRDLVRSNSIESQLRNEFNQIVDLHIVGFNDPEMKRDLVRFTKVSDGELCEAEFHQGMMADIYVKVQQIQESALVLDLASEDVKVTEWSEDDRFYKIPLEKHINPGPIAIRSSCVLNPGDSTTQELIDQKDAPISEAGNCQFEFDIGFNDDGTGLQLMADDDLKMYSSEMSPNLILPKGNFDSNGNLITDPNTGLPVGPQGTPNNLKVIQLEYMHIPELEEMQQFVNNPERRTVVSDLLILSFVPVFIDVDMPVQGNVDEQTLESKLEFEIFSGDFEQISDLVNLAYEEGANSVDIDNLSVSLEARNRQGDVIINDQPITNELTFSDPELPESEIRTLIPRDVNVTTI